jgi:hypothetical protein
VAYIRVLATGSIVPGVKNAPVICSASWRDRTVDAMNLHLRRTIQYVSESVSTLYLTMHVPGRRPEAALR